MTATENGRLRWSVVWNIEALLSDLIPGPDRGATRDGATFVGHGYQLTCARWSAARFRRLPGGVVSSSAVEVTRGPSRDRAHSRPSRQRVRGLGPNFLKGGPPPRLAFVASVFGLVGYPASVSASASCCRVNNASGSGNAIAVFHP